MEWNSKLRVCLIGPANPGQLQDFMFEDDRTRAAMHDIPAGQPVVNLARSLLERGHYVSVVSIHDGQTDLHFRGERFTFSGLAISRRARWRILTLWGKESRALRDTARMIESDIVHAHWTYEYANAGLGVQKPLVITAWDAPFTIFLQLKDGYRFFRLLFAHWVTLRARARGITIAACSPYLAESWKREMFWWRDIPVVVNAVEEPVNQHTKAKYPLIVEAADSSSRKNVKNLIRAMRLVRKRIPEANLALLGHGLGDDGPVADWARRQNLDEGVVFMGHQNREVLEKMIGSAWLHAHVSREESFGLTVVEAMAAGTAVLGGKDSGAVPWILEDGEAGLVVNVERPEEIADGICRLILDEELRNSLVERARKRYETDFSPEATVNGYLELYDRIIKETQSRKR